MDFPKAVMGTLGAFSFMVCCLCPHMCPTPFWKVMKLGLTGLRVAVVPAVHIPDTLKTK